MPPRAKKVKADPEPSHPAAVLARGAQLTGVLARLPVETLVDILVRCTPRAIVNLLATCQALRSIASHSETFIYRALYHGLLAGCRPAPVGSHVIYSPVLSKKGETRREYVMSAPLPGGAVYSWKVQYIKAVAWDQEKLPRKCMECNASQFGTGLLEEPAWQTRLCHFCFAKNLVNKSSLKVYSLTSNDVVGLIEVTLRTLGGLGNRTTGKFYSAQQLVQLATQKHGDKYKGPRPIGLFEKEERESRENLVGTATLLHGGLYWDTEFVMERYRPRDQSIDYGHFATEFNHYIKRESYKKNKKASVPHPYGHTWSHDLVRRPIEEILADYTSLVQEHGDDFPCIDGRPLFRPAASPGPLLPTETSIEAYRTLVAAAKMHHLGPLLRDAMEVSTIRALQAYVLTPSNAAFEQAMDRLREEFFLNRKRGRTELGPSHALSDPRDVASIVAACITPTRTTIRPLDVERIKVVSMIWAAMGLVLPVGDVKLALDYTVSGQWLAVLPKFIWFMSYFEYGSLSDLARRVYLTNRDQIRDARADVCAEVFEARGHLDYNRILSWLVKDADVVRRYRTLSDKPASEIVCTPAHAQEAREIAKSLSDGIMSASGLLATAVKKDTSPCPYPLRYPKDQRVCTDSCWLESIDFEMEFEDLYSDDYGCECGDSMYGCECGNGMYGSDLEAEYMYAFM